MSSFGTFVRHQRIAAGLTLTEFAARLGKSPAYWSRVETDKEKPPTDEVLKKAAAILAMDEDTLFIEASRLPPDIHDDKEKIEKVVRFYRNFLNHDKK